MASALSFLAPIPVFLSETIYKQLQQSVICFLFA